MLKDGRNSNSKDGGNGNGNRGANYQAHINIVQNREQQEKERKVDKTRLLPDFYEFRIHPDVKERGIKYDKSKQSTNTAGSVDQMEQFYDMDAEAGTNSTAKPKGSEAQGNPNIAITKYFEDAIRSLTGYQELANDFWVAYRSSLRNGDPVSS